MKTNKIKQLALESITVIVSILLAFGIDAWWDARSERRLEQEYISAIYVEITGALDEVRRDIGSLKETKRALDEFFASAPLSSDSLRRVLVLASIVPNIAPPTAVLDDLVASGRLRVIRSSSVREKLMLFRQDMAKNRLNEDAHRDFANERFIPYLSSEILLNGTLPRGYWGEEDSGGSESNYFHSSSDADFRQLQQLAPFQNIMLERQRALARVLPVVERMQSTLVELEQELGSGGN